MAEAYGPQNGWFNGNDYCQAWCTVSVLKETNTQITFKVEGQLCLVNVYQYGMKLEIGYYNSGSSGSYTTTNTYSTAWTSIDNAWYPRTWLRSDLTFDKGTSARNITFFSWCHGQTVNGYDGYGASSEAKVTMTIPAGVFKYAPNPPTSVTLKKNSDTSHTLSWAFTAGTNRPIETQDSALQTNDGAWAYTTINNGTTKSASLTTAANSKYYAAVRLKNSAGTSAWTYSNTTYTTPATPSAAVAIKTGSNVSLQATVTNIRYPKSYQWQRASNSSFSSGLTTLSGTAAVISDTTSLATPYYRVRCLGQSGTYSGWRTATLSTNPQLYVQIPTGKTIQDVYIRKG